MLWNANLWALLDFNTLLHAHLLILQLRRSLIRSSTTKSPGDEDAMQMYLKQMMHSMSLIQSCGADHPAVSPKKLEGYSFKEQQVAPDTSTWMSGLKNQANKTKQIRQSWRCSQPAYGKTDRVRQVEAAKRSQTQTGRSVSRRSRSSTQQGKEWQAVWERADRAGNSPGLYIGRLVRGTSLIESSQGAAGGGERTQHNS